MPETKQEQLLKWVETLRERIKKEALCKFGMIIQPEPTASSLARISSNMLKRLAKMLAYCEYADAFIQAGDIEDACTTIGVIQGLMEGWLDISVPETSRLKFKQ